MENRIAEKVKEKLELYGFTEEELTSEEMETLRGEIKAELDGHIVLDGVLFNKERYKR